MARKRTRLDKDYVQGLRLGVRENAQAFAFSIMITSSFGVVASLEGAPRVGEVWAFMPGAVLGFVAVLVVATAGFRRKEMEAERTDVLVVGAALALGSTASGLGAATLVAYLLGGLLAWGLAPFAASAAFLFVVGLEFRIAEEVEG